MKESPSAGVAFLPLRLGVIGRWPWKMERAGGRTRLPGSCQVDDRLEGFPGGGGVLVIEC